MRAGQCIVRLVAPWLLWTQQAGAHGGKSLGAELHAREAYAQHNKMDLSHCSDKFRRDGVLARAAERRISRRETLQNTGRTSGENLMSRESSKRAFDPAELFETYSSTGRGCVLHPELTEGPYYVEGEKVRSDVTDNQAGVVLFLDFQVVDSHTCEPVEGVYVEIWHTNSTGVYSGVVDDGNGAGHKDPANAYRTYNRGAQKTDNDGVAFFKSIFPGHYSGRTSHIHLMTHIRPKIVDGTIVSDMATHIGQLFFEQRLVYAVEQLLPYRSNKQEFTTNTEDYYFQQAAMTSDPIMSWLLLDHPSYDNAVLGWMPIGINMSNVREADVAATLRPHY